MTSRDLHDGATAKMLASRIGTVERLKQLTMLTYADISAVNPQAMTPWRLEQLWLVYLLAYEELTRELHGERIHNATVFLEGLPVRYLRTHTQAQIHVHTELARQLETRAVAIEIEHEKGVYRLTLLTRDRTRLFTAVAGAISSFGLSIVKAEAFSNSQGIVVDTFTFSDPHRTLELNPPEVDRLRGIVRKVVEGKLDVETLLRARPRPLLPSRAARLKPRVAFNQDASESATLIEIVAEDRPGLLYDLAQAISAAGCNIEVVLIDTEAHKPLDVFYVTAGGKKLERRSGIQRLKGERRAVARLPAGLAQIAIHGFRRIAPFRDRPHYQRLSAPRIARREHSLNRRLVLRGREIPAMIHRSPKVLRGSGKSHRQQDQIRVQRVFDARWIAHARVVQLLHRSVPRESRRRNGPLALPAFFMRAFHAQLQRP